MADPAVTAWHAWLTALEAIRVAGYPDMNSDEGEPLYAQLLAAERALAEAVPTTPKGLAAKARYACELLGECRHGGERGNPDDYEMWCRDEAREFVRSLLTLARNWQAKREA